MLFLGITAVAICVIAILGLLLLNKPDTKQQASLDNFPLLAKRVLVDEPSEPIINFTGLRSQLNSYFTSHGLTGSVYFEYLPTGTSIRINGDNQEVAASLIKLPIAMVLYKTSELGKINLDNEVSLKKEWLDSSYGDLYRKGEGYKLPLRQAAKIMLSESDNTALGAIANSIEGLVPEDENPFAFLDADFHQNEDLTVSIGARSYSSFLKCLYYSCYLDKKDSQEILTWLTESKFNTRMTAKLGKDVTVAHKIGTYNNQTQSDCGIVYVPKRNYVFCAMIDGPDNASTDAQIAELSKIAYDFVKQAGSSR